MKIPFLLNIKTYDEAIKHFSYDAWICLPYKSKIEVMNVVFLHEKELLFKEVNFNVSLEIVSDLKNNIDGMYSSLDQKIYLNVNDFYNKKNGYEIYKTIIHELYHSYQDYMIKNQMQNYNNNVFAVMDFYQNGTNKTFKFLNFSGQGNFHIDKYNNSYFKRIDDLLDIIYFLNISERQAFEYQYKKCCLLLNNDKNVLDEKSISNKDYVDIYSIKFNEIYGVSLEKEQICKIIDDCFYMLSQNLQPETDLEASVMYDISCLALLENNKITEIECNKMLQNSYKKVQLAEYGYCLNEEDRYGKYVITNGLKSKAKEYSSSKQEFKKLTPFEQQDNPYIILLSIVNLQEEIKDDILKSTLDPLFTYANAKQEYLYPDAQRKLLEWYPEKYHEYLDDFEL